MIFVPLIDKVPKVAKTIVGFKTGQNDQDKLFFRNLSNPQPLSSNLIQITIVLDCITQLHSLENGRAGVSGTPIEVGIVGLCQGVMHHLDQRSIGLLERVNKSS